MAHFLFLVDVIDSTIGKRHSTDAEMTRRVQQLLQSLCDTCAIRHSTESKRLLAAVGSLMCVLS